MADDNDMRVTVVGGGIAGTEAALTLARHGIGVRLLEMRPAVMTPAHHTADLAELVCSNSLKSEDTLTAAGALKRELQTLGSHVLAAARSCRVPAGAALAVDRSLFARTLTRQVQDSDAIELSRVEADSLPEGRVIIATGPLTSSAFEPVLERLAGRRLAFFDAAAPIVDASTLDRTVVFAASRYGKGHGDDYLNIPLDKDAYDRLVEGLVTARRVTDKTFDRRDLFSACQPIEEIARTGPDALRFGPLKPVGLTDPHTGRRPWAVVQLRAETAARTAYNLVGFQTNLAFEEQRRVFGALPGLGSAEFLRYGVMHRNTFVDAPRILDQTLALRQNRMVRMAGQVTGTEGYLEAAASGLLAALNTVADIRGWDPVVLPDTTILGSLIAYATDPDTDHYQPMHVNFGLVPPLQTPVRGKRSRYAAYSQRAQDDLDAWLAERPELVSAARA